MLSAASGDTLEILQWVKHSCNWRGGVLTSALAAPVSTGTCVLQEVHWRLAMASWSPSNGSTSMCIPEIKSLR